MPRPGRFPHVTDLLAAAGLVEQRWFRDFDLARGSALHAATQYLDEGSLEWGSVDPVILGRLRSYQKFLDEVQPLVLAIEERVENEVLRYEGKLDRRMVIKGREAVVDLKGPARAPWQALQVAMYAACFPRVLDRYTLHLDEDRYQLIKHEDRNDWTVCKAILTLNSWKERNNGAH